MSAHQDEIARIIAGFSRAERFVFARMGGSVPAVACAEPNWFRPGIDQIRPPFAPCVHDPSRLIKVEIGDGRVMTIKEASVELGINEAFMREKMRRYSGGYLIRGVMVRRLTPRHPTGKRETKAA